MMNVKWIAPDRGRWMAAVLIPLLTCSVSAREQPSESRGVAATPPVAAPRQVQGTAFNPPTRPARQISRQRLGEQYCLVRTVDDGQGSSRTSQLPIVGVPNAGEWVTDENVDLKPVAAEQGNCGPSVAALPGNALSIKRGADDNHFEVSLLSVTTPGDTTPLASATFSRPDASGTYQSDAFLYSRKNDASSSGNGGIFGQFDFYLYVVDIARSARSDVSKLVLVEWFDPQDPRSACHAERPETAMKRRADVSVCELPAWIPSSFGWPSNMGPAPKMRDVIVSDKQTGTGGGYEPPG